jgi:energy-coupling factor transport system substrate-specific component
MLPLIAMWKNTRMIVLVAVTAAIYATAEVVFSSVSPVIIPGVVEFKVSDLLTMLLGILFGPAGAWGVAIGNVFGDAFTGNLAVGSIFGFLSTFAVAYIGYTMWWRLGDDAVGDGRPKPRLVVAYLAIGVVAAVVAAIILAWGLDLLGIAPFKVISDALVGNFIFGNWLGAIIFFLVYPRFQKMHLTWTSIMAVEPATWKSINFLTGVAVVTAASFAGWILGAFVLPLGRIVPVTAIFFFLALGGSALL